MPFKRRTPDQFVKAGDALREHERFAQKIVDMCPSMIYVFDLRGHKTIFVNRSILAVLGHNTKPEELQPGFIRSVMHPDDWPRFLDHLERLAKLSDHESDKFECRMRYSSGKWRWFESLDKVFRRNEDGSVREIIGTAVDVTERKTAEENESVERVRALNMLRASEERFGKAFRISPDGLVISRLADGVILELNDSFVAMTGLDRAELMGRSTVLLGLYVNPADRQHAVTMLKEQGFVRDFEFQMKRKSGEIRLMSFSADPLELDGVPCWLTVARDITERKQFEKERELLLQQEKSAREEAEGANRMKDEFLATVSHELRTPLTSIVGWTHLLNEDVISRPQGKRALEIIRKNAQAQAGLIDDILDMSRIITGRLKLDVHPLAVGPVFAAAVDIIRPSAEAKRIDLRVAIEDEAGLILGDATRLQQAFWNLLSNAIKFTNEGGVVEARLIRFGEQIEVSVRDTGVGIEPQFLPHLFTRFTQADSTSTRRYGGLGLGLSIVRHVVEMLGGTVSASSEGKGLGATFTVRFPVALIPPLPGALDLPAKLPPKTGEGQTQRTEGRELEGVEVLVVDDDLDTLEMLRFVLLTAGAVAMTASSTAEALEVMERSRPDVLISDLAMPDQDGYDLIRRVRSRSPEEGGSTPAIALTAYVRPEDRIRSLAAGFQMHVPKPVDPGELVAVVASLIRRFPPKLD